MMAVKKSPVGRPAQMKGGKGVQVYLDAPSVKFARQLGEGNVSEGIRRALRLAAGRIQAARGAAMGSMSHEQ